MKKVEANNANIDIWMSLLDETLERDSFAGNNRSYYEFFLKNLNDKLSLPQSLYSLLRGLFTIMGQVHQIFDRENYLHHICFNGKQ